MRILGAVFIASQALTSARASVGEVPSVDGVIGGVPFNVRQRLALAGAPKSNAWENPLAVPGKVRLVENSGLCEKTPGVYEAAGYADLTKSDSIWFWFFAARNNPDTAPLVLWFNGGPGSSSMLGLFQAHGPCRIANDSQSVLHNSFSWNTNANMLYIDQPAGVGFSVSSALKIKTSQQAAVDMWKFLQIWLSDRRFGKFKGREVGIWAESYGGHYGPAFAKYFMDQNNAIALKKTMGIPVNLTTLGIGNGLTDPLLQYPQLMNYAVNNPYHPLVNDSVLEAANDSWDSEGGCRDQIKECYSSDSDTACSTAQTNCNAQIISKLNGIWDPNYVLSPQPDPYPADFSNFLNQNRMLIKTQKIWVVRNLEVYLNFASTGDWMRNSRYDLEEVVDKGLKVLVYAGDADYIANHLGLEAMMDALETKFSDEYRSQSFKNYTVDGVVTGLFKKAGTLSYLRVYGAGHVVPAYTFGGLGVGEAALQMFDQVQSGKGLKPT